MRETAAGQVGHDPPLELEPGRGTRILWQQVPVYVLCALIKPAA